jgi:hypothetical protein
MNKINVMKNRELFFEKHNEPHPMVGVGLFLIALGLALLVATNDLLNLGSVKEYFTWETALVFIGALLLLNLQFTGGLILIALGTWFFIDNNDYKLPEIVKSIYWPSVIILVGLGVIFSSLFKRRKRSN